MLEARKPTTTKKQTEETRQQQKNQTKKTQATKPQNSLRQLRCIFEGLPVCLLEPGVSLWLAPPSATVLGFALFGSGTQAASLCRTGGLKGSNRTQPPANLFSELATLGANQKRWDSRVTLHLLIDQMVRITDSRKPRAFLTI